MEGKHAPQQGRVGTGWKSNQESPFRISLYYPFELAGLAKRLVVDWERDGAGAL